MRLSCVAVAAAVLLHGGRSLEAQWGGVCPAYLFEKQSAATGTCAVQFGQTLSEVRKQVQRYQVTETEARGVTILRITNSAWPAVLEFVAHDSSTTAERRLYSAHRTDSAVKSVAELRALVASWQHDLKIRGADRVQCAVSPNPPSRTGYYRRYGLLMRSGGRDIQLLTTIERVWPHLYRFDARLTIGVAIRRFESVEREDCVISQGDSAEIAARPFSRDMVQGRWFRDAM